jgi:RNA polymerase sigma factor (sigma-70 family)
MITRTMIPTVPQNDAKLVAASLNGNRDAFGQIVSRYQSLVCSLAYSATGSLSQSEDLAQDTFVTAWKQLRDLREPEKLRAWLCGIARNLINNFLRKEGREPSHRAESLEQISEGASPEPLPVETTISKEEAAILWRSLERIPELYREPLILFYREHQSVELVAVNLDLTEDNVKQRLSRGRKLLQEQFVNFVEGALAQTNPGRNFTLSVISALPAVSYSAKAAVIGTAAAKGSAAAKSAGVMGLLGALFTPLAIIFGNYASYRMSVDEAHSDHERKQIKRLFLNSILVAVGLSAILAVPLFSMFRNQTTPPTFWGVLFSQTVVIYFLTLSAFVFATLSKRRRYLARILAQEHGGNFPPAAFEYRSSATLFGLPLIHIRTGDRFDVMRGPVKAWIAIGSSHAVGVIFASGGLAIAPISFGGIAIGLLPFGAFSLGVFAIGAVATGVWAFGAAAVGWQICCGCGIALHSAIGGIVFAREFALGGFAVAAQANNAIAQRYFNQDTFFHVATTISNHNILLMLAWIIPVTLQSQIIARARRRRELAHS